MIPIRCLGKEIQIYDITNMKAKREYMRDTQEYVIVIEITQYRHKAKIILQSRRRLRLAIPRNTTIKER